MQQSLIHFRRNLLLWKRSALTDKGCMMRRANGLTCFFDYVI